MEGWKLQETRGTEPGWMVRWKEGPAKGTLKRVQEGQKGIPERDIHSSRNKQKACQIGPGYLSYRASVTRRIVSLTG